MVKKPYEYLYMPPTNIASPTGTLYTMQQKLEVSVVQVIRLRVTSWRIHKAKMFMVHKSNLLLHRILTQGLKPNHVSRFCKEKYIQGDRHFKF